MSIGTATFRWMVMVAVVGALAFAVATITFAQQRGPSSPPGPPSSHSIHLVVEGETFPGFIAVEGLSIETKVEEHRDGGGRIIKIPGRTTYGDITLKRGVTAVDELWEWYSGIVDGDVDRRNGSIIVYDQNMREIARYHFSNAWPSKWNGPTVGTTDRARLTEQVVLTVERLEKAD